MKVTNPYLSWQQIVVSVTQRNLSQIQNLGITKTENLAVA